MRGLSSIFGELLDAAVPSVVEAGLREASEWEPDPRDRYCPRCGATVPSPLAEDAEGCALCVNLKLPWESLTRLAAYEEPANGWLRAMKFGKQWAWAGWFGEQLAEAMELPAEDGPVWVVPVPMPWLRRWGRGYNQAQLIAEALAEKRGWRCAPLLRRSRYTPPQTAIPPSQRPTNIRDSFAVEPVDLTDARVVLVDDIKTSGSTLKACTQSLKKAGARKVHVAVVAVADPKSEQAYL